MTTHFFDNRNRTWRAQPPNGASVANELRSMAYSGKRTAGKRVKTIVCFDFDNWRGPNQSLFIRGASQAADPMQYRGAMYHVLSGRTGNCSKITLRLLGFPRE